LIDIYNFFNDDIIMSPRVTNLNSSVGNCKLGRDCRPVRLHRRHDSTRQLAGCELSLKTFLYGQWGQAQYELY